MNDDEARQFIASSRWTFAKTMPQIPHEYTLKKDARDQQAFENFVQLIHDHGYNAKFGAGNATFRYYDVDDRQYWYIGAVQSITLINRAKKKPAPDTAPV